MQKNVLKYGRNDPCPCKSGKKYKNCCMNAKSIVSINYKDEVVMVDKAVEDACYKQIIEFNDSLTPSKKLNIGEGLQSLIHSYELLDKAMKPFYSFTPCKKGCSTCCNLVVEITAIEADLIKDYVIKNFGQEEIKTLEGKLKNDCYHYPNSQHCLSDDSLRLKHFKLNRPCSFLSPNGECTIYEVRPINCRSYLVFSDPETCKPKDGNRPTEYGGGIVDVTRNTTQRISSIVYGKGQNLLIQTLPHWFKNGFDKINLHC